MFTISGQISAPPNRYPDWPARLAFNERLLKEVARQPGVMAAGIVNNLPLSGDNGKSAVTVRGTFAGRENRREDITLMEWMWRLLCRDGLLAAGGTLSDGGGFPPFHAGPAW